MNQGWHVLRRGSLLFFVFFPATLDREWFVFTKLLDIGGLEPISRDTETGVSWVSNLL